MKRPLDDSHDPGLRSWVTSANDPDCDFPLQNLPFGVFRRGDEAASGDNTPRVGVAIGDQILDLRRCRDAKLLSGLPEPCQVACSGPNLNPLLGLGRKCWSVLRNHLSRLLRDDSATSRPQTSVLVPIADSELLLPAAVGDYTDFYSSVFHATNCGRLFRPNNPLLPNYKHVPIAYHGRSSSLVPSGTPIGRPHGQRKEPDRPDPVFGPSQKLDYEMEVGWLIGPGNELGRPVSIDDAEDHVFGLCLVNDWSARDVQAWEYQPLGPFLAKSFATSVSPWMVTLEALAPFRCRAFSRVQGDPQPLPYLTPTSDAGDSGIDVTVEVLLQSERMRQMNTAPVRLSRGSFRDMYWTLAQIVTHHASNGCNLRPGDLLASGTVSGPEDGSAGCLLEMTRGGTVPVALPSGEERLFLSDGDEVILRGYCQRDGYARVGFGECRGVVVER